MITDRNSIKLLVQNIITSGTFEEYDIEVKRKIILLNIVCIIAILNLIPLGIVAFIQDYPILGFFDLILSLVLIIIITYLRKSGYNDFVSYFGVFVAGLLFLYLFITGGVNNTGHLWSYSFPVFALFLLGSKRGAIATLMLFVPSLLLLIVGSYSAITAIYTTDFKIRFIPSFLVVFGFSYFFEKLRERTQQLLAQKNAELEETISNLKQAQSTLREKTHDLGERIKELNCLYGISNLVEKPDISLEEIFQGLVYLIPPSWQYPEITCSRIILEDKEYKTENFKETNWKQSNEIFVSGKRMGVLEICYLEEKPEINEGPFLKEERNLINAITERLAHIIERMQTREEKERLEDQARERTKELHEKNKLLEDISNTDALTSVANRRHFDSCLSIECKRLSRSRSSMSLIMCDIDHFKTFNDTYGHQAGDECLKNVAAALCSIARRETDFIARYGGEEFVIVLPDTKLEMAVHIAEKARDAVKKLGIPHKNNAHEKVVTMSFGVNSVSSGESNKDCASILISKADEALYAAKEGGRNRVIQLKTI